MPLNREFIGREYPPLSATVMLEALQSYARAYNDDNPRYFDPSAPGGIVAPPMFGVAVTWMSVVGAVGDPSWARTFCACCTPSRTWNSLLRFDRATR